MKSEATPSPRKCLQCGIDLPDDHTSDWCELCEAEILTQEMDFYE
jgi:hypothetical protein